MKLLAVILSALSACALQAADLDSLLVPVAEMRASTAAAPASAETAAPAPAAPAPAKTPAVFAAQPEVLAALRDALTERFQPDGTLRVEASSPWKNARVNDAAWRVELTRVPATGLAPRMAVSFRIYCGDDSQGEYSMLLSCAVMRDVFVTGRRIDRGDSIGASDFTIQQRDVLATPGKCVTATTPISEYRTRAAVAEGQILQWRDVELRPLIHKGQIVEAVASEGAMRISIKAVALEDGRQGDVVSVRNLSTSKEIQARILDERTVQVYF